MSSIISTFHIDWKIIIAQMVNFGVVFLVLYFFALKPLTKLMLKRSEKIGKGINDAKVNAELLQNTQAEYEKMLVQARKEADNIFQTGKKEGEAKKAELVEEGKAQFNNFIENGKKALQAEKVKMVEEAKKDMGLLATLAAEKILSSKQDLNNL